MQNQGWVDIAYTGGYCQHGYTFAGRGFGVRTAANGSNTGNQNYYAFCFLGGVRDIATTAALNALEWWVREARTKGGAGVKVVPHSALFATACPGPQVKAKAATLDGKNIYAPNVVVSTGGYTVADVKKLQDAIDTPVDGDWGPATETRALWFRERAKAKTMYVYRIRYLQAAVHVSQTGVWDTNTENHFQRLRNQFKR